MAIAKQNSSGTKQATQSLKALTAEIKENMIKAVKDGKKDAVEKALLNYKATKKVKDEILSA